MKNSDKPPKEEYREENKNVNKKDNTSMKAMSSRLNANYEITPFTPNHMHFQSSTHFEISDKHPKTDYIDLSKKHNISIKEICFGLDIKKESTPYCPDSEIHIRSSQSIENLDDAWTFKQKMRLEN